MGTEGIIQIIHESLFLILVFGAFLMLAMVRGKQALTNMILGLYLALLVSLVFPYYDQILSGESGDSLIRISVFLAFTILGSILFGRLMPPDPTEPAFFNFTRKLLLALMAAVLVMAYSFHVLPVTELITPGTPIQTLFAPEAHFIWWLLLPLVVLFFL